MIKSNTSVSTPTRMITSLQPQLTKKKKSSVISGHLRPLVVHSHQAFSFPSVCVCGEWNKRGWRRRRVGNGGSRGLGWGGWGGGGWFVRGGERGKSRTRTVQLFYFIIYEEDGCRVGSARVLS